MHANNSLENFHTPLPIQAFKQFEELRSYTQTIQLSANRDRWIFSWENSNYTPMKMYKSITTGEPADPIFKRFWKNATMLKFKIFFWLLLYDRVNTRNLLHRKSFHLPTYSCELCQDNMEETTLHLFWDCPFALACWDSIVSHRNRRISSHDEIMFISQTLPSPIAMEITIMGCWHIWMQRNGKLFKAQTPSVLSWRTLLRKDLLLLKHRIKHKFQDQLNNWIEQHLS